jgi:hypothetical protein
MSSMWIATLLKFSLTRTSASRTTPRGTCLAMPPLKVAVLVLVVVETLAAVIMVAEVVNPHRSADGWAKLAGNTPTAAVAVADDRQVYAAVGSRENAAIARPLDSKLLHCLIPTWLIGGLT